MGEQSFVGVGEDSNAPEELVEAVFGVEILQTGQLTPSDILGSAKNPPDCLAIPVSTATILNHETVSQEAQLCLCRSSFISGQTVSGPQVHGGAGPLYHCHDFAVPSLVRLDVHPKVLQGVHPLHHCAKDVEWL